jgi:outer membrane protein assembly factor BamB
MPADLDELFGALGRQADVLPLGGADDARLRGRERTRIRAVVSVATAVVLVAVGTGLVLRQPAHRAAPPAAVDGRPMPEVGSPIDLGGPPAYALPTIGGGQVYTAWIKATDNSLWLTAADLRTGARTWAGPQAVVDPLRHLDQVVVVPSAVLVVTRAGGVSRPGAGLFAFDPATGAPLWHLDSEDSDSLVFADRMLIRLSATTHVIEGLDWTTGKQRWTMPASGDRPVRALGMAVPADDKRIGRSGPPADFSDGRFVVITEAGAAQVRDVATGALRRTVPVSPVSGAKMVAYDGWLYSHDSADDSPGPQHIRATDLVGGGGTSVVQTLPGDLVTLAACGPMRVCAVTQPARGSEAGAQTTTISSVDVRKRRLAWKASSKYGGDLISSAGGRTLLSAVDGGYEFFDAAGRRQFDSALTAGWLDAATLMLVAPDGTGRLARWAAATGRMTPFSSHVGDTNGNCASTSNRLVCVGIGQDGLRIWNIAG